MVRRSLALLLALAAAPACETYDPPPETSLVIPSGGQWFPSTPLTLRFTEPVDPATLTVSVWPTTALDAENFLVDDAQPLLADCNVAAAPCGETTFSLSDDGLTAQLSLDPLVTGWIGKPLFVQVHEDLADLAGRPRRVFDRFPFQVSPEPSTNEPVEVNLETGVVAMVADLTSVLSGIYLRIILDIGIDPETGEMWMIGTVAKLNGDHPPNTTDPLHLDPRLDGEGWAVFFSGQVTKVSDEEYFIATDTADLHVKVLGLIDVQLKDLRLEGLIKPGQGPDGRDLISGTLTSSKVLMGDPADPTDLAAAAAGWTATGLRASEIVDGLPRLCDAAPCTQLAADTGFDCQLPSPWTPGPDCQ